MLLQTSKLKGIPPKAILERELHKKGINQRTLALAVGEHPQTLNAILKGRRKIPVSLSLKIEKALDMEEGILSILQTFYEIEQEKNKVKQTPDLNILTPSLFWDTDLSKLDWNKYSTFVIQRTFERGSEREKEEIVRFYGKNVVDNALSSPQREPMKLHQNILKNVVL